MEEYPLDGIRIVDFTWAWAGPYATLLLAMLGAEVIKVESQRRLDHTRLRSLMTGPTMGGPNQSAVFNDINLNKLSLTLNLAQPRAIEVAKRLVKVSDVVTQNMRPGVMERLGLGYEVLREVKPDIIMLSSSAVGTTGPERTYVGYAPTFAALSGLAYVSGHAGGPPSTLTGAIDTRVGTTAAFAILAALNFRQRTGKGQYIDISSAEAISCLAGDVLMDYTMNRRIRERDGNRDELMVPHGCYSCRGENCWITIAVSGEEEWQAFCKAIGSPDWTKDRRFADADSRRQNQSELDRLVTEWTRQYTDYEVMETLQRVGVAAIPTFSGRMVPRDPHVKERGILAEVEHPELGKRMVVGPPWRLSATPARIPNAAPLIGEHNQYVLGELLGMSHNEIDRLVEEEVVY
jgi:benzylsuccinate CoA-transferase BbsF subunit